MEKVTMPKVRLSIYGCLKTAGNTLSGVAQKFDWIDATLDSAILAAITFFSTLGGGTVAAIPSGSMLTISLVAAGAQFFTVLGIKRKLIKGDP